MKKHAVLFAVFITCLCNIATPSQAQQPTATVRALSGRVLLVIPQQEPVRVNEGDILQPGDVIELKPGASATLALSDGSEIQLGENTKLDIAVLTESPQGARQSGLKLFYGRLRAFLSGDHQKEGSSFEVETPNAQVGVKFSQPDVLVSYDPELETTFINAYTVGIKVKNLITGAEVDDIPKGHQAIVKDKYIQVIKLTDAIREVGEWGKEEIGKETEETEEEAEEEEQVKMNALLGTRSPAMASISASPGADFPTTSQNPVPGKRPVRPDNRIEPVDFTLIIDNE
ncbi:MAG: FecR domain-containing protein [bacterium]|nr:FecR domain-containing protein [bacterium]